MAPHGCDARVAPCRRCRARRASTARLGRGGRETGRGRRARRAPRGLARTPGILHPAPAMADRREITVHELQERLRDRYGDDDLRAIATAVEDTQALRSG